MNRDEADDATGRRGGTPPTGEESMSDEITETQAQSANLRQLAQLERRAREIGAQSGSLLLQSLARIVEELARCAAHTAEVVPPIGEQRSHVEAHGDLERRLTLLETRADPSVEASLLEPGREYDLILRVRVTVLERSSGHGLCYKVRLEDRDYQISRIVDVDADEISSAGPRD